MKYDVIIQEKIDCEFSNDNSKWTISKLVSNKNDEFIDLDNNKWKHCRIRMNEWLVWNGGDQSPIDNENTEIHFRNGDITDFQVSNRGWEHDWKHDFTEYDIIKFKVYTLKDQT